MSKVDTRVKLTEGLIVYAAASVLVTVSYMCLGGTYPFNAFLSSLFCNLALMCLGGRLLRLLQLSLCRALTSTSFPFHLL
jgi:hypothetical protein